MMLNKKLLIAFVLYQFSVNFVCGQNKSDLDSLRTNYQKCLDKGQFMSDCARNYFYTINSMDSIIYNKLFNSLDLNNRQNLKKEQNDWLKKKEEYLEMRQKKYEASNGGLDELMFMYDDNAAFIEKRILDLISRMKNKKD